MFKDTNIKWSNRHNNGYEDFGNAVEIDSNNNVIAVANSFDGKKYNTEIRKYDENGSLVWYKTYESRKQNMVYDVTVDSNDNIIIIGLNGEWTHDPLPDSSTYVAKYDKNGNFLWIKFFKHGICTIGFGVVTDSEDNVLLISTFFKTGEPNLGCWIIKCDEKGNQIWNRFYQEHYMSIPYGIAVDSEDNAVVIGYAFNPYKINGIWTGGFLSLKYDKNGNLLWKKRYLSNEAAEALAVYVDSQSNIIIVGKNNFVDKKFNDIILIKTDRNGDVLWEKKHRNNYRFSPFGLDVNNNGDIIIGGTSYISKYPTSFIGSYSKNGELKWIKKSNDKRNIFDISVDKRDSIVSVGSIIENIQEFYILKETVD